MLSQFYIRGDKEKAKEAFNIKPNNTHLLLMCGSMGCGPMKQLTEDLSQRLEPNCEISVVCGTNQKLFRELEQKFDSYPNIHIHGFVQDMSSLMDSADLYLTKPGGLSTSEALAKALPMVLIDAVAGCIGIKRIVDDHHRLHLAALLPVQLLKILQRNLKQLPPYLGSFECIA